MSNIESNIIPDYPSPVSLFTEWFADAKTCDAIKDATAMTLATVDHEGQPWTRTVLLKDHDEDGFTFYTNSTSIKGRQVGASPKVSLCFYWAPLDRQVRILGSATQVPATEADEYFASRPRESQIGAWASKQSTELDTRQTLMDRVEKITKRYEGGDVPRPEFWNGYRVSPTLIEFWLSRPHRLHERAMYTRQPDTSWTRKGLYP